MNGKTIRNSFFILVLSLFAAACSNGDKGEADVKPRAPVKVAAVTVGDMTQVINVPGSAQALRDEKIRAVISGKVVDLKVLEGDYVRKGQALLTIISKESDAAIAGAREMVALATTDAQKNEAEKALELAQQSASKSVVAAPFDGTISNRVVTDGEYVTEDADLLEIVDNSSVYFMANLPIQNSQSVHRGQKVIVKFPTTNFPQMSGIVAAINPDVDPSSQRVDVRITFNSVPQLLKPGIFGIAAINIGERMSVLLVPKSAVYHDDELNKYFVVRAQGDTLALLTPVNIGLSDSTHVEIISGLSIQDIVVTSGGYGLPDSTGIEVK
ncbi:MAG: efflux RND transporter periplasmic adaptor subunit [Candidatus Kryptoniota bacterium]